MAALWKEHLTKVRHFFFPTLCMWEEGASVNPGQWGGNVAPDQTVADACISTAAIRVSRGKVGPLSSSLFMSVSDSLTASVWVCTSVWSHTRTNVNEKGLGQCVKCVSYLIHITRGNSIEHSSLPNRNSSPLCKDVAYRPFSLVWS